jgi:hypothetical protein
MVLQTPPATLETGFAETVPTTLPGVLAMIVYANELADEDADVFSSDEDCTLLQTLATAAKALMVGIV